MLFSKDFLKDRLGADDTVDHQIVGHSRWSITYREVFKFEDKFYETGWMEGATEMQDERPYEYDGDEIECDEVYPMEKVVTVYERI